MATHCTEGHLGRKFFSFPEHSYRSRDSARWRAKPGKLSEEGIIFLSGRSKTIGEVATSAICSTFCAGARGSFAGSTLNREPKLAIIPRPDAPVSRYVDDAVAPMIPRLGWHYFEPLCRDCPGIIEKSVVEGGALRPPGNGRSDYVKADDGPIPMPAMSGATKGLQWGGFVRSY